MTRLRRCVPSGMAALIVCGTVSGTALRAGRVGDPLSYTFVTLSVPGASNTDAWDINNEGVIVGHYLADSVTHGFVRAVSGAYSTLDVPGAVFTQATAINDRAEIAGTYRLPRDSILHAFLRAPNGAFATIDVPGATSSLPRGLNEHGDVTFEATVAGHITAYVRSSAAYLNIEPLPSFAGAPVTFSYASGINNHRAVVGRYDTAASGARGFLLDSLSTSRSAGGYTTLHFPDASSSAALGIDDKGVVVGGYTMDAVRHGYVLVDGDYATLDVPGCSSTIVLGAMTCTTPRKINDSGQIVGFYGAGGNAVRGFLAHPQ